MFASEREADLSAVCPLLVAFYMLCYTPFMMSEVTFSFKHTKKRQLVVVEFPRLGFVFLHQLILLGRKDLSPAPTWLRTLSSVMSYLDCGLNPLIYFYHQDFREAFLAQLWTIREDSSEPVLTSITKREP